MTDWNNKEEVLEELQADREVVLVAVKQDGSALRYASDKLRADKEVVLVAVKSDEGSGSVFQSVLEYADNSLKNDPEFMKEVEQYL